MLNKDFLSDIIHTLNTIADNINTAGPSTTLEQGSINIQDDTYNISYCFGVGEHGYMAHMWITELEGEEDFFVIDIMIGKEPSNGMGHIIDQALINGLELDKATVLPDWLIANLSTAFNVAKMRYAT